MSGPRCGGTPPSREQAERDLTLLADQILTVDDVDHLLARGCAEPLLTGHRPVPVRIRGRWWRMPSAEQHYRPAPPAVAESLETRARRMRDVTRAVAAGDDRSACEC